MAEELIGNLGYHPPQSNRKCQKLCLFQRPAKDRVQHYLTFQSQEG